jgi:hypothetical protein
MSSQNTMGYADALAAIHAIFILQSGLGNAKTADKMLQIEIALSAQIEQDAKRIAELEADKKFNSDGWNGAMAQAMENGAKANELRERVAEQEADNAKLTVLVDDLRHQLAAERELPHAYMLAKLAMVIPLFEEARDALPALNEIQRIRHGISATLADRMDIAGTFSIEDWQKTLDAAKEPA